MEPFEIMISESQERMVAVVEPEQRSRPVPRSARAGSCTRAVIGEVVEGDRLRCRWEGEVVGDMPVDGARGRARATRSPPSAPTGCATSRSRPTTCRGAERSRRDCCSRCSPRPTSASRALGLRAVRPARRLGHRAAPRRRRRRRAADAVASARSPCRSTATARAWPRPAPRRRGGGRAGRAQRRLHGRRARRRSRTASTSAIPSAASTAYALREAIDGMAEACEALGTPVVSGNVSLYNEHGGRPIHPTPVVGCVGVLERAEHAGRRSVPADRRRASSCSATAAPALRRLRVPGAACDGAVGGPHPRRRPARAGRLLRELLADAAREGLLRLAHDASDGGLAVALAEVASAPARARVELPTLPDAATMLFGECADASCSCAAERRGAALARRCERCGRAAASASASRRRRAASGCDRQRARHCRGARPGRGGAGLRRRRSRQPDGAAADVRRLRHPRARPRRRAARVLRALRAAAPRPGERRHRRLRRAARDRDARTWGSSPRSSTSRKLQALQGRAAIGHARYSTTGSAHWLNAQPIVRHRARPHRRARPQRQPHQHRRAARGAARQRRAAAVDLRHRGHLRADRAPPGHAARTPCARRWRASRARSRRSC